MKLILLTISINNVEDLKETFNKSWHVEGVSIHNAAITITAEHNTLKDIYAFIQRRTNSVSELDYSNPDYLIIETDSMETVSFEIEPFCN